MKVKPHILVIDDEPQILRALRTILEAKRFQVSIAATGEQGLAFAASEQPDVIILDLGLPDIDGVEVCARLREWSQVPVIVLSVRDEEKDKVLALDEGADDYLVKPFGIGELLARIRVALRHSAQLHGSPEPVVRGGDLEIDLARRVVRKKGKEVKLTATEFNLLAYLASNAGRVLTHRNLLEKVWGPEYTDNVEYLRVFMSQLRRKLEQDPRHPRFLISDPGVGYRFSSDD
ncbi:MAG TPA: response regulator [Anaerolineales bacterium]|jgi:two-component system KDP operon response regulator KdpE